MCGRCEFVSSGIIDPRKLRESHPLLWLLPTMRGWRFEGPSLPTLLRMTFADRESAVLEAGQAGYVVDADGATRFEPQYG